MCFSNNKKLCLTLANFMLFIYYYYFLEGGGGVGSGGTVCVKKLFGSENNRITPLSSQQYHLLAVIEKEYLNFYLVVFLQTLKISAISRISLNSLPPPDRRPSKECIHLVA